MIYIVRHGQTEWNSLMRLQGRSDDFYQIMTSTGAFTLTDLTELKLRHALEIIQSLSQNREVHKFALHLISNYLTDYYKKRKT